MQERARAVQIGRRGLTLRLGGTPITINPTFLLLVAFYVLATGRPWQYGLMFAGVALVGILWHELGHALAFRMIGRPSRIVVHGIGGVTIADNEPPLPDPEGAGVALAGPLFGIAVGLVALWLQLHDVGDGALWSRLLMSDLVFVNLGWGLLNLLPVLPLDGGQVVERVTGMLAPRARHTFPYLVGIATAVTGLVFAWRAGLVLAVLFAAMFAALNVALMVSAIREARAEASDARALAACRSGGDPDSTIQQLHAALERPLSPAVELECATHLGWLAAWRGTPADMVVVASMVGRIAGRADSGFLGAVVARARGARDEAAVLLARGFAAESTPPPPWFLDRYLSTDEVAAIAARLDGMALGQRHQGLTRLAESLERTGRTGEAGELRSRLAQPVATHTFAWVPAPLR